MGPDRFTSIRASTPSLKPYEREGSPIVCTDAEELAQNIFDRAGFPTYEQYKAIETNYLDSLCPKRRAKALIPQALFDRIWDVMVAASCNETAQFRFWVRKMFRLTLLAEVDPDCEFGDPARPVLVHDGLLVAVQEKVYSLLCYFHEKAGHAGRDKTCAFIRRSYTWIPKDLVAQFVKACPTCKSKRQGRVNGFMTSLVVSAPSSPCLAMVHDSGTPSEPSSPDLTNVASSRLGNDVPLVDHFTNTGTFTFEMVDHRSLNQNLATLPLTAQIIPQIVPTGMGPHSHYMSREVSLYRGLPNGWQFHSDYAKARIACIEMQKRQPNHSGQQQPFTRRPRIPSIAPMMTPPVVEKPVTAYLATDQQQKNQEEQYFGYVNPALLSMSGVVEKHSGRPGAQPQLCFNLYNQPLRSSYASVGKPGDVDAFLSPGAPSRPSTPELVKSVVNKDSPFVTELSTPQDELVYDLGDGIIYDGTEYTELYAVPLTNAMAHN